MPDSREPVASPPASPPPLSRAPSQLTPSSLDFPVIGIGGSAGGLEALLRLFEHTPPNPGMAFVVILHLSPDHQSSAAEILQRNTSMKVVQVTRTMPIEVDHVYVISPRLDLLMNDNSLQVEPSGTARRPASVDVFFRTLAEVHRERAVCIVMSGTGSDGAVGVAHVKEHGGLTMAQIPEDAAHDGMPQAAIATGMVDFVLPAGDMGQQLIDLWRNARQIRLPHAEEVGPLVHEPGTPAANLLAEKALQEVMALLRTYTRHDFRQYKRATVLRRIERRMQVNRLVDLPAYRDFLRSHPEEATPLLQDMLISVTNFFRDREAFDALALAVVAPVVARKQPGEQARVWVAGCATGEEAYSLSMLLREQADLQSKPLDIQVFATDIDERAIAAARKGIYPQGIAEDMAPARLRQFFVKDRDRYRVSTSVREPVLFALHNLLRDPPFSRLDVICCRNLLIYLDRAAQAHVLEMFRVALKPGGYLFLGTSESTDAVGNLFTPLDKKHRIYQANPELPAGRHVPLISDAPPTLGTSVISQGLRLPRRSGPERPSLAELHQRALEQFSPPSVLIDNEHNVLHLSNGVGRFLERASGEPSENLLNNVRPDIRIELRTALFKAAQSARSVETRLVQRKEDGRQFFLNITVRPLQQ